jgi:hypothetical protein
MTMTTQTASAPSMDRPADEPLRLGAVETATAVFRMPGGVMGWHPVIALPLPERRAA